MMGFTDERDRRRISNLHNTAPIRARFNPRIQRYNQGLESSVGLLGFGLVLGVLASRA